MGPAEVRSRKCSLSCWICFTSNRTSFARLDVNSSKLTSQFKVTQNLRWQNNVALPFPMHGGILYANKQLSSKSS